MRFYAVTGGALICVTIRYEFTPPAGVSVASGVEVACKLSTLPAGKLTIVEPSIRLTVVVK